MRRTPAALAVISSALLLTACSSPATTSSSSVQRWLGSHPVRPPPQVVPQLGAGQPVREGDVARPLTTGHVFTVEAGQDPSPAAAQADWSKERARAQRLLTKKLPAGISLSLNTQDVSGLGDRAAVATGSASAAGQVIGFSGIYLLKGATFVGFQSLLLGHAAPSASAMEAQAQKTLARVP